MSSRPRQVTVKTARCLEVGNHHLKPTGAKAGVGPGLRLEFVCKRCRRRFWQPPQLKLFADPLKAELTSPVNS